MSRSIIFNIIQNLDYCYDWTKFSFDFRTMSTGLEQRPNEKRRVYYKLYRLKGIGREVDELVQFDAIEGTAAMDVIEVRKAVKEACSAQLQNIDANQLVVYPNCLSAINDENYPLTC